VAHERREAKGEPKISTTLQAIFPQCLCQWSMLWKSYIESINDYLSCRRINTRLEPQIIENKYYIIYVDLIGYIAYFLL